MHSSDPQSRPWPTSPASAGTRLARNHDRGHATDRRCQPAEGCGCARRRRTRLGPHGPARHRPFSSGSWTTPATRTARFMPGCWPSFQNVPERPAPASSKTAAPGSPPGSRPPLWIRPADTRTPSELPDAITVLDAFHVVKLGSSMVDEVHRSLRGGTRIPLPGTRTTK